MPYIGNNHIAGDHTNNFKVLDDISSFTATFDGSATSVVDTTNNTIRVIEHRFVQGQRVTYTNGSGGNIGGLTTGTAYFIIFDSASTIKLATSASNAANSTAINLSAVGTGSSHTLNAAFDGVNTKFKITYNSGTGARFNNATQLNIAINNVLQKPNVSSITFTEGFAIEDNHKIVFKTAPTSEDIFWGSIIANTLTTFDISDHNIDTFTGDGSTTEFTLSHTPANNESLMVTINGVLQHPSNASTARAYTLIASIIQFTAAPGVGDEIQVRHLGFAGATTADVSGFYGRTGNVVLTSNDHITTGDITARNINASGILTASSASFGGNVSIGGTLTYEDVSNIDSVGIITARDGIHVGAGVSAVGVGTFGSLDIDGDLDVDGHTNLDNVSIAGVTTIANDTEFKIGSNANNKLPLKIKQDTNGNVNYIDSRFTYFRSHAIRMYDQDNTSHQVAYFWNNQIGLYALNYERLRVTSTGVSILNGNLSVSQDIDVDGHTNLDNVSIAGVTTFAGNIDLQRASASNIRQLGTGPLQIRNEVDDQDVVIQADNGSGGTTQYFRADGSDGGAKLYNYGSLKFETISTGAQVTGNLNVSKDLGVDGHTNLDNVSIAGVTTITGSGASVLFLESSNPMIRLTDTDNSAYSSIGGESGFLYLYTNSSSRDVIFRGSQEVARITGDGKLGIGTVNPTAPIHLHKASGDNIQKIESSDGAAALELRHTNGYGYIRYFQDGAETFRAGQIAQFTSYSIYNPSSSLPYQFCVEGNGEVGINTHNPTNTLHLLRNSTNHGITLQRGGTNAGSASINITSFGALDLTASNNFNITSGGSQQIFFNRGGTAIGKFDVSGNFNLGLTASPVSSSTEQGVFLAGANSTQSVISSDVTALVVNRVGTGGNDRNCIEFRNNGVLRGTIGAIGASNGIFFQSGTTETLRITSTGELRLSNSDGIQLSAKNSNLYTSDGSLSYYSTTNAVYLNGAGASGWLRLNAAGSANNRTAINIYGHSVAGVGDTLDFRTNSTERLRISANGETIITPTNGGSSNNRTSIHFNNAAHSPFIAFKSNNVTEACYILCSENNGGAHLNIRTKRKTGAQNAGSLLSIMDFGPEGEIRTYNSGGGQLSYPLITGHDIGSSGAEYGQFNYHDMRSPVGGLGGWVELGIDYNGAHPYPPRAYKIARHENGRNGTRVYHLWHDGDANYHYGGMWEIRLNEWGSTSNKFESVHFRCINGRRNDVSLYVYDTTDGIWVRPHTIWGRFYLRRAGWDDNCRAPGSSYCAITNGAALAFGDTAGANGSIPSGYFELYPFDGAGGNHTGGRYIENNTNSGG